MGIAILVTFGVIIVFVMAFKRNTSETTMTKKDEDGKIVTEHYETVHHSVGTTAARIVVGIIVVAVILFLSLILGR
ncbi:MAG: hypothetical protein HDR53_06395 [Treponema sp.]|nr:hypothetical protein [Treponema sp.]